MKVFIDTGAFLALADKADAFHKTTTDVFQDVVQQKAVLYTSNYVIDETITLIRAKVGHKAAVLFIKGIGASNIKELRISEEDEGAAKEISSSIRTRPSKGHGDLTPDAAFGRRRGKKGADN